MPPFILHRWQEFALCLVFLTRLPLPLSDEAAGRPLYAGIWAFPVVGLILALPAGLAAWATAQGGWPPLASALLGLAILIWLSGALHEDGLADLADGFGGGFDKDRKLAIMRDSRIGAYGVLALVLLVGLKAALISGLPGPGFAWLALLAGESISRALIGLGALALAPVRDDGRSAAAGRPALGPALAGIAFGGIVVFCLLPPGIAALGLAGAALGCGVILVLASRQIGGQTGDVLGAVQAVSALGFYGGIALGPFDFWEIGP
ncbi:MAG: adenosylcobinamide-GDP ribazoletransferase [Magnetovibrionaceae bacterium]